MKQALRSLVSRFRLGLRFLRRRLIFSAPIPPLWAVWSEAALWDQEIDGC